MIIDGETIIMGSFNCSKAAEERNAETNSSSPSRLGNWWVIRTFRSPVDLSVYVKLFSPTVISGTADYDVTLANRQDMRLGSTKVGSRILSPGSDLDAILAMWPLRPSHLPCRLIHGDRRRRCCGRWDIRFGRARSRG